MDDSISSSSENKWPLVAAFVALAIAGLALILALKARSDAKSANEQLGEANKAIIAAQGELVSVRSTAAKASDVQAVDAKVEAFQGEVKTKVDEIIGQISAHKKILEGIKTIPAKPVAGTASAGTAPVVAGAGEYVVKSGDTPRKIASANHVSVTDLIKANPGMEPSKLRVGQKIKLPVKGK